MPPDQKPVAVDSEQTFYSSKCDSAFSCTIIYCFTVCSFIFHVKTPDGIVELKYWIAVVRFEETKPIKAYSALNESHIAPKQYEKMNVGRAYQVMFV